MLAAATAALAATLVVAPAPPAQDAPQAASTRQAAAQTPQTVDVARGTKLVLQNFAGEVIVRTWDKDAVKVDARHLRNRRVQVERRGEGVLEVKGSRGAGGMGSIDYELTVPAWMSLRLTGTYLYVAVEGVQGEIVAETVRGDLAVKGGSGTVSLKSIEGNVTVEGAKGRLTLHSADGDVSVTDCSGEVAADTLDGSITLTRVSATSVDASTIDGDIIYDGGIAAQGQYLFTTHDGNVFLRIPENTNATLAIRTYEGRFDSSLPVQLSGDYRRGRRVTGTLGKGGAEIEIEAFDGRIRLLKPGEPLPEAKRKQQEKDKAWQGLRR